MHLINILVCSFVVVHAKYDWTNIFPNDINISTSPLLQQRSSLLRLIKGKVCDAHSYPYQVGMFIPISEGLSFCGGSLIAPQTILTAAHCVHRITGPVDIVLGAHRIRQNETSQYRPKISKFIIHPDWAPTQLKNDIALITLEEEVTLNEYIQLITLSDRLTNQLEGREAVVTGWGRLSDNSKEISPILRQINVTIVNNSRCSRLYRKGIEMTHMCTFSDEGRSTCSGDSGGPLVVDGKQVGIVSFGSSGCEYGWPMVFTRVSSYLGWIEQNSL